MRRKSYPSDESGTFIAPPPFRGPISTGDMNWIMEKRDIEKANAQLKEEAEKPGLSTEWPAMIVIAVGVFILWRMFK